MEVHFNKLEAIEAPILDEVKVMVLLISLLDNYQNVITMMETLRPVDWTWDRNKDVCNYCKEQGHWAKDCTKKKKNKRHKQKKNKRTMQTMEKHLF